MSNFKMTRVPRSLSSYGAPLNKENHLDFVNRIQLVQIKDQISNIPKDVQSMQIEVEQAKVEIKKITKLSIETNVNTEQMAQTLKMEENLLIAKDYSIDILNTLIESDKNSRLRDILFTHNISKELRCRMVDWMIQVIATLKCTEQSFLTAVRLMDTFFMKAIRIHEPEQVHLTGVTCIYIATKYEQVHPLKLKTVFEKVGHRKLSIQSILKKQTQIMQVIGFNMLGVNHFQILEHLSYIANLKNTFGKNHFNSFNKVCVYLSKLVLFDIELITMYSKSTIACCVLYLSFNIIIRVFPQFSPDILINEIISLVNINRNTLTEASSKLLNLAKSFDKIHSNLHNLRKFNKFDVKEDSAKPTTTR